MKMLTYLQRFKGFSLLCRRAYVRNILDIANHIYQIYFSYESYNEEQGIKSILQTSSFFTETISFLHFLQCVATSHIFIKTNV